VGILPGVGEPAGSDRDDDVAVQRELKTLAPSGA
jgi:hypothetical protein